MIFHPINTKRQEGSFVFCNRQTAVANAVLCKEIFSECDASLGECNRDPNAEK